MIRFNELTGKSRSTEQLKLAWKRMKRCKPPSPSPGDLQIMSIAPHDFLIEVNDYDSDAVVSNLAKATTSKEIYVDPKPGPDLENQTIVEEKNLLNEHNIIEVESIVLVFYAIFYAVLAAMFAVCMTALFYTLDEKKPAFILSESLIGDNPGVSYRPIPDGFGFITQYHVTNISETHPYILSLQEFRDSYKTEEWLSSKEGCSADDQFGYPDSPCFFIKVNKIYGWVPEYYDASNLPSDMPEDLQNYIKALPVEEQKQVWVSCFEEHKENSNDTQFEYPWGQGLPARFFPFTNQGDYKSPLVAVKITPSVRSLVVIRCRAWAKNIIYANSIKEASGYARIQLFIEGENSTDVAQKENGLDM